MIIEAVDLWPIVVCINSLTRQVNDFLVINRPGPGRIWSVMAVAYMGGYIINTRIIVLGGMLTGFSVLFQVFPVVFTEFFVIVTMLASLPIYVASRIRPSLGITVFIASGILIWFISPHEGIFFLFANGPIGLSLGVGNYFIKQSHLIPVVTALITTITLSFVNYLIGIPVFGFEFKISGWLFIICLYMFLLIYSCLYLFFLKYILNHLTKVTILK